MRGPPRIPGGAFPPALSAQGAAAGAFSYGIGLMPPFALPGNAYVPSMTNPIANGGGGYLSARAFGEDESSARRAWRNGYWSGSLTNSAHYIHNKFAGPPKSGQYLMSRRLNIGPLGTMAKLFGGIGHYAPVDVDTGRTRELLPRDGRGVAAEHSFADASHNSYRNFGYDPSTSFYPLDVSFDQIPLGDNGGYFFLGNNSNTWANGVNK